MTSTVFLIAFAVVNPAGSRGDECREIAGFQLCGAWSDHVGYSTVEGTATLAGHGAFSMELGNASLEVHLDPPSIEGEVDFALPAIGPLADWGVDGQAPRAHMYLGIGENLDSVEIGGVDLPLNDEHPYLVFDIDSSVGLSFNGASVSASTGPSTKVIIDPLDPLIYLEGDVVEVLTRGLVSDGAVGVSLGGWLPYSSSNELYNGSNWKHREITGNLYARGNMQVGRYPVFVSSTVVIDADANNDGDWFFEPEEADTDFRVGADGEIAIGYDLGAFSLTLPVASGSMVYRADSGRLMVYGEVTDPNPLADTVLDPLFTDATTGAVWAHYDALDDFTVQLEVQAPVLGFAAADLELTLSEDSIAFRGSFEPRYGQLFGNQSVRFDGSIDTEGQYVMSGVADLDLAGMPLAEATVVWTNSGVTAHGTMEVPGLGAVQVDGSIQPNGVFSFTGRATFAPLGLTMSDALVTVSHAGVAVDGLLQVPGLSQIRVSGLVQANGNFSFSGDAEIEVMGFELASAHVEVSTDAVYISGRVDAIIAEGNISGRYDPIAAVAANWGMTVDQFVLFRHLWLASGQPLLKSMVTGLRLYGDMDLEIPVPGPADDIDIANAQVSIGDNGMRAKGWVGFHGVEIKVSGSVKSGGEVKLKGKVGFNVSVAGTGVKGDLEVTASNTKLSGKLSGEACVNVVFTKFCGGASATVSSNGRATLNMPSPIPDLTVDVRDLGI